MTDLADLVETLKREVAVPGTFSSVFTETTDQDLTDSLLDAFAASQLDGFLVSSAATDDGFVSPDLSRGAAALLVVYAGIRFLGADLANRKSHVRYEANGAVFEQDTGPSVLVELLKGLRAKKDQLILAAQQAALDAARAGMSITVVDGYYIKAVDFYRGDLSGQLDYRQPDPYGYV